MNRRDLLILLGVGTVAPGLIDLDKIAGSSISEELGQSIQQQILQEMMKADKLSITVGQAFTVKEASDTLMVAVTKLSDDFWTMDESKAESTQITFSIKRDGVAAYINLYNDKIVYYSRELVVEQSVARGNTVTIPSFNIEIEDSSPDEFYKTYFTKLK